MIQVLTYSLLANLSFSFASVYFAIFSKKISVLWVNTVKAIVCFIFLIGVLIFNKGHLTANFQEVVFLVISGFIALCIGDLFMLEGMKILGGSRVVMMFGLTPFFTGIGSYFLFQSTLSLNAIYGVAFMIACLLLLSFERYKAFGQWHLRGILMGVVAVFLDNMGLLLTKASFNQNPQLHSLEANLYRVFGALLGFMLINFTYRRIDLKNKFIQISSKDKVLVILASFFGTFLSLYFYLKSVNLGHLSIVSSMTGTGPLFTEIFESIRTKKAPHPLWWLAFVCFIVALYFFTFGSN
ncbi:MAG: DMT family transporter [Bdellovibrionales bacterium]|nr:DMT family transporter [Bdellovibrionales bacterium]